MITDKIRQDIMAKCEKYMRTADVGRVFDFWTEHISLVVKHAVRLAKEYGADVEIVELGALLHDVAKIDRVGEQADHHIKGADIAIEMLRKYNYDETKTNRVEDCVINHRSSLNANTIEETCVADADALAHFDNPFKIAQFVYGILGKEKAEGREELRKYFEKDFNTLSARTQKSFKPRFDTIMDVLFGGMK